MFDCETASSIQGQEHYGGADAVVWRQDQLGGIGIGIPDRFPISVLVMSRDHRLAVPSDVQEFRVVVCRPLSISVSVPSQAFYVSKPSNASLC
jgi:hypothetical protein